MGESWARRLGFREELSGTNPQNAGLNPNSPR